MFCPNCGANNSTEQNFCRACGLNLENTAQSLLEQLPTAESANLLRQTKLLEKFGNIASIGFGTVLLLAILAMVVSIFSKMVLTGEEILFGLLLIAFIISAAMMLSYVFLNEMLKEKKAKKNPVLDKELDKELEKRDTAKLLEDKPFEPAASVTENSTELLLVENKTRKIK